MVSDLLLLRKLSAPVAVFLRQIFVILFRNANGQALKSRDFSVAVLFSRSIFEVSLPVPVVTENIRARPPVPGQSVFKFFHVYAYLAVVMKEFAEKPEKRGATGLF